VGGPASSWPGRGATKRRTFYSQSRKPSANRQAALSVQSNSYTALPATLVDPDSKTKASLIEYALATELPPQCQASRSYSIVACGVSEFPSSRRPFVSWNGRCMAGTLPWSLSENPVALVQKLVDGWVRSMRQRVFGSVEKVTHIVSKSRA
jgi:hypothetical protein